MLIQINTTERKLCRLVGTAHISCVGRGRKILKVEEACERRSGAKCPGEEPGSLLWALGLDYAGLVKGGGAWEGFKRLIGLC